MDSLQSSEKKPAGNRVSDHLANERTFLAWIRTALGIMAFGFVVVKFTIFLKQLSLLSGNNITISQKGLSSITGIFLVVLGVATILFAYIRYRQIKKNIESESYRHSGKLPTWFAAFIMICGLLLAVYLVLNS